jgi:hypothetical protein
MMALLKKDDSQIIYRIGPTRLTAHGSAVFIGCFLQAAGCLQGYAVIKMQGGIVAIQGKAFTEHSIGFVIFSKLFVNSPQVVISRNIAGFQFYDPSVSH